MDQVVMEGTQQRQVGYAGFAPVQPVLNVVAVQEARVRAAREATATVAQGQRAPYRGRNRTRAAADVQFDAVPCRGHHATIAGDAAKRFRGNASPIVQTG